jgi:hypothetical protein
VVSLGAWLSFRFSATSGLYLSPGAESSHAPRLC